MFLISFFHKGFVPAGVEGSQGVEAANEAALRTRTRTHRVALLIETTQRVALDELIGAHTWGSGTRLCELNGARARAAAVSLYPNVCGQV